MRGKRTSIDFSKHELTTKETNEVLVHWLKKPNTICGNVKFINVKGDVLVVVGDYGNWVFCREFHPSKDGCVSDSYWVEKLKISSTQNPYTFDPEKAKSEIDNLLKEPWSHEEIEFLNSLRQASDLTEGEFVEACYNYPSGFDTEMMPTGKVYNHSLLVVFDAFEEICKRLSEVSKKEKECRY